jgi:hypothetical protein
MMKFPVGCQRRIVILLIVVISPLDAILVLAGRPHVGFAVGYASPEVFQDEETFEWLVRLVTRVRSI